MITQEQKCQIIAKAEWDGTLEYALRNYDWSDIKDDNFHSLVKAYVESGEALEELVGIHDMDVVSACAETV